tara:strand:- start:3840 stop:5090 length:1251 start_codon:yes stop_codon:yes gene_type:complete
MFYCILNKNKLLANRIKKIIYGILFYPMYLLSTIWPRSSKIWIFGAWYGKNYSDNPAYIYEYIVDKKLDIIPIWLTQNKNVIKTLRKKGFRVYSTFSIQGFWYALKGAVTFINCGYEDVNKYCIKKSIVVQLWHGVPLKKIKNDDEINNNLNNFLIFARKIFFKIFPFFDEKYDILISSGKITTQRYMTAFRLSRSKIFETGFPRSDIIKSEKLSLNKDQIMNYKSNNIHKLILYAPTHRAEGKSHFNIFSDYNLVDFNKFLKDNHSLLFIKLHFYEDYEKIMIMIENQSNIVILNNNIDINRILFNMDILITDYSSVFYDYLILDRPIIFTPFDIDEYQTHDRELYVDYNQEVPGPVCLDWGDVKLELKKLFNQNDSFLSKRKKCYNKYFKYSDDQNTKRVINSVIKYLNRNVKY